MNKMVYKAVTLTGEGQTLLPKTQISLGKKKCIGFFFFIWINYDFHYMLLQFLGL